MMMMMAMKKKKMMMMKKMSFEEIGLKGFLVLFEVGELQRAGISRQGVVVVELLVGKVFLG